MIARVMVLCTADFEEVLTNMSLFVARTMYTWPVGMKELVYSVYCIVYSVHCILYNYNVLSVHYKLYSICIQYTLYNVQCIVCTIHCKFTIL